MSRVLAFSRQVARGGVWCGWPSRTSSWRRSWLGWACGWVGGGGLGLVGGGRVSGGLSHLHCSFWFSCHPLGQGYHFLTSHLVVFLILLIRLLIVRESSVSRGASITRRGFDTLTLIRLWQAPTAIYQAVHFVGLECRVRLWLASRWRWRIRIHRRPLRWRLNRLARRPAEQ